MAGRRSVTKPLLAIALVLAAMAAGDVERAAGCSCAPPDAREWLAEGRAALIGEVTSRRRVGRTGLPTYEYRVRVERGFNAELGPELALSSSASEASCGFSWRVGDRVGAFLERRRHGWTTNLCLLVDPAELESGLAPFPTPAGRGRMALLAAGDFGSARLMALDTRGRVLAYGAGEGTTRRVSVCPGSRRAVELVETEQSARVAVRILRSMRVLRSVAITRDSIDLRCQDARGASVLVSTYEFSHGRTFVRVLRVRGKRVAELAEATGEAAALGRAVAYVGTPGRVLALDLATGAARQVLRTPFTSQLALSPDGRQLALLDSSGLRLVDLRRGRVRSDPFGRWGPIAWLGRNRLLARLGGGEIRIYDRRLNRRATHGPYRATGFARVGRRVFGVNDRLLVALDLHSGDRTTVSELPDRDVYDLQAVLGRPKVNAPGNVPFAGGAGRTCGPATRS